MSLRFIDGAAKSSGQRLDSVNWTLLVLASGNIYNTFEWQLKQASQEIKGNVCEINFKFVIRIFVFLSSFSNLNGGGHAAKKSKK